jgi:hypothetical protein
MSTGGNPNKQLLIVVALGVASLTVLIVALRRRNRRASSSSPHSSKQIGNKAESSTPLIEESPEKEDLANKAISDPISKVVEQPSSSANSGSQSNQSVSFSVLFCTYVCIIDAV